MKVEPVRGQKFASIVRRFGGAQGSGTPMLAGLEPNDPLGVLLTNYLLWESSPALAEEALVRISRVVVDVNELRVMLEGELAETMGEKYPFVEERARRLRATLHDVFRRQHRTSLDHLRNASRKDQRSYIEGLAEIPPFVAGRTLSVAFELPAPAVDDTTVEALHAQGAVESNASTAEVCQWIGKHHRLEELGKVNAALEAVRTEAWIAAGKSPTKLRAAYLSRQAELRAAENAERKRIEDAKLAKVAAAERAIEEKRQAELAREQDKIRQRREAEEAKIRARAEREAARVAAVAAREKARAQREAERLRRESERARAAEAKRKAAEREAARREAAAERKRAQDAIKARKLAERARLQKSRQIELARKRALAQKLARAKQVLKAKKRALLKKIALAKRAAIARRKEQQRKLQLRRRLLASKKAPRRAGAVQRPRGGAGRVGSAKRAGAGSPPASKRARRGGVRVAAASRGSKATPRRGAKRSRR